MGQQCPVPQQIPFPPNEIQKMMREKGFVIEDTEYDQYVYYTLPQGWRLVNNVTFAEDIKWEFVDPNNFVQFIILGYWRSPEDSWLRNRLRIVGYQEPKQFTPVKQIDGWHTMNTTSKFL